MTFATLLFLAHIVARALARKGTIQRVHLDCFLRRLHAKGAIGARGESFIDTMKKLVMAVVRIATFDGFCPVDRQDRPPVWMLLDDVLAAPCATAPLQVDSS